MPNIVQGNSLPGTATNRQIVAYVQELEDQLRYVLANLGAENMAPDAIKVETLAPDVRKVFADSEQNMARITANAKRIEASVAGKYDKVASIGIDESGITMTGGAINMEADTEINIKSDGRINIEAGGMGNINLMSGGGGVSAESGNFTGLTVDGKTVGTNVFLMPVRVAMTQDAVTAPEDVDKPFLWINATTSGSGPAESSSVTPITGVWTTISQSYNAYYDLQLPESVSGDQYHYKLKFKVWNRLNTKPMSIIKINAQVTNGNGVTVDFESGPVGTLRPYQGMEINASASSQDNLFDGTALQMRVLYTANEWQGQLSFNDTVPVTLSVTADGAGGGGGGVNNTDIKWVTQ